MKSIQNRLLSLSLEKKLTNTKIINDCDMSLLNDKKFKIYLNMMYIMFKLYSIDITHQIYLKL